MSAGLALLAQERFCRPLKDSEKGNKSLHIKSD